MAKKIYQALTLLFVVLSLAIIAGIVSMYVDPVSETSEVEEEIQEESISMGSSSIVVIDTNLGEIKVELDLENAPVSSENFLNYVEEGFYENLIFHRVIDGFMVQGGGFDSAQVQKETNNPIVLESNNGLKNLRGTIAMARTNDPNSATSQFFINLVDNSFLDYTESNPGYAVFGKVISGMDVVDKIAKVEVAANGIHQDWPVSDVVINQIYLEE